MPNNGLHSSQVVQSGNAHQWSGLQQEGPQKHPCLQVKHTRKQVYIILYGPKFMQCAIFVDCSRTAKLSFVKLFVLYRLLALYRPWSMKNVSTKFLKMPICKNCAPQRFSAIQYVGYKFLKPKCSSSKQNKKTMKAIQKPHTDRECNGQSNGWPQAIAASNPLGNNVAITRSQQ